MTEKYLIGVDIGTQGTKAVLFSQSGACLANHFKSSTLFHPQAGAVEEDPECQLESVCDTVQACLRESKIDPKSVAAVALCGQMAGIIGVNQDGRHVTPYDSWLDTRCAPYIEKMKQNAGDEILAKTGCFPSFNHGPKILWWKSEEDCCLPVSVLGPVECWALARLAVSCAWDAMECSLELGFGSRVRLRKRKKGGAPRRGRLPLVLL